MRQAADEIRAEAVLEATEATIEGVIERVVYSRLRDIGFDGFHPRKEVGIDFVRDVQKGRADSRIRSLVIEYKRPSLLRTQAQVDKACGQLQDYLIALSTKETEELVGFLTNGLTIVEIHCVAGVISRSARETISAGTLLRLVKAIVATSLTALTASNLVKDFCEPGQGVVFELARTLLARLQVAFNLKTEMLFGEWMQLFSLAHDDVSQQKRIEQRRQALAEVFSTDIENSDTEYKALFCLHTAYAILLKFIAYRTVTDSYLHKMERPFESLAGATPATLRVACARLEDGEVFRQLGIKNLLEGDFFSWYSDSKEWSGPIATKLQAVVAVLARYEDVGSIFAKGAVPDLFRELYEATVPQVVRASFGEFYTPAWLAEHVLDRAIVGTDWRVLDPCCGSGTFLINAIARLRSESGGGTEADLLDAILSRVMGVDLNPLAVLTARIHYFIHVSDLIEVAAPEALTIPVFLGDTASAPTRETVGGVPCLSYELKTLKRQVTATLPESLVADIPAFFETIREFEGDVRAQRPADAAAVLSRRLASSEKSPGVLAAIQSLSNELVELERQGWNGIWGRILANFLATACLGTFSAVVGNPPWIDWKSLPLGYRNRLKDSPIVKGLFSGDGRTGGINLNICALVSFVAAEHYLAPGGRLAFLMPKELVNQASYEGWRRLADKYHIAELHDWTDSGHPFDPVREDFMTYVITHGPRSARVPVAHYRKKERGGKASKWESRSVAMAALERTTRFAAQVIPGKTAYTITRTAKEIRDAALVAGECAYYGREGIEFYPQELLLFRYERPGPKPGTVWLQNLQVEKSKHRVPSRQILLETKYLRPLVKGPEIRPFHHAYSGLIVPFPYEEDDPHRPVEAERLRKECPLLYDYYVSNRAMIEGQTKFSDKIRGTDAGDFYGLARTGPYSFARRFVGFRDNTDWRAAVISDQKMPWGEHKAFVFQNHAVSMCERKDGRTFIGEDEAHYICAILNAPIVARFIDATSDNRSFKIRPPVYVPAFDAADADHRRLVQGSRKCHADPDAAAAELAQIEAAYLRICRRDVRGARAD